MNGIEGALCHLVSLPTKVPETMTESATIGRSMRVVWLVYLSAMACGCVLAFYSVVFMRADFLAGAVVSGAIVFVVRSVLKERLAAAATEETIFGEEGNCTGDHVNDGRVGELVQLLREWDGIERARGTADFDPWALQSARHEIHEAVQADPMLERLFRPRA